MIKKYIAKSHWVTQVLSDTSNNPNPAETSLHLEGSEKNIDLKYLFLADYAITLIYSSALYI